MFFCKRKTFAIVREEKGLGSEIRFEQAGLKEPSKDLVLNFKTRDPIDRESFMVILDREANRTFEVVVSITNETVVSWTEVPSGQQASFVLDEYTELEETVKMNSEFQAAAAKQRITDMDLVMVDPWSAGYFGVEEDEGRRIGRALCFVRRYEDEKKPVYGAEVAPRVFAPHHQHFFNYRIDTQVDGEKNSVIELNTVVADRGRDNPNNNAFYPEVITFETEMEARRNMNIESARRWRIINEHSKNQMGQPVGYSLEPGENCSPFANDDASVMKRAPFLKKHIHVTQYDPTEMFAPGDYPNQKKGGGPDELSKYAEQNRNIRNEDIVLWYNMGLHHYTRPEDFPVMPTAYIGFKLKPVGFFDRNPALDLPRPTKELNKIPPSVKKSSPLGH